MLHVWFLRHLHLVYDIITRTTFDIWRSLFMITAKQFPHSRSCSGQPPQFVSILSPTFVVSLFFSLSTRPKAGGFHFRLNQFLQVKSATQPRKWILNIYMYISVSNHSSSSSSSRRVCPLRVHCPTTAAQMAHVEQIQQSLPSSKLPAGHAGHNLWAWMHWGMFSIVVNCFNRVTHLPAGHKKYLYIFHIFYDFFPAICLLAKSPLNEPRK